MTQEELEQKAKDYATTVSHASSFYNSVKAQSYEDGANMILQSAEYKQMEADAKIYREIKERLSNMLKQYEGEDWTTTSKQEIVTETHYIVSMVTKYELNW